MTTKHDYQNNSLGSYPPDSTLALISDELPLDFHYYFYYRTNAYGTIANHCSPDIIFKHVLLEIFPLIY